MYYPKGHRGYVAASPASLVTEEEFQEMWNSLDSAEAVAKALKYGAVGSVKVKATNLRKRGYSLKFMPRKNAKPAPRV